MKLVSLNIWGGRAYTPFVEFVKTHAADTDIFCFQEILSSSSRNLLTHGARANILGELTAILTDFDVHFAPEQDGYDLEDMVDFPISMGQATFTRKSHRVDSTDSVFVYRGRNQGSDRYTIPSNFQYIRLSCGGKPFTIGNIHGIPYPGTKIDTPERLEQSRLVNDFFAREKGAKIICGDFNLLPETRSVKMIEEAGMRNLIMTHGVPETRSKLSPYYGTPKYLKFADYIFVSDEVKVHSFEVPSIEVSDHLPMILEFS